MYHQIFVSPKDRDAFRFVSCKFWTDPIGGYGMSLHIFGKIDSPYIANWVLKKTAKNQAKSYSERAFEINFRTFLHGRFFIHAFKSDKSYKYMQWNIQNFEKWRIWFIWNLYLKYQQNLSHLSGNCQSVNLDLDKIPLERALGI